MGDEISVVWFKRDLRLVDHEALSRAAHAGPVICLYVFEPELYQQPDFDSCHLQFILESLQELSVGLEQLGSCLYWAHGEVKGVLEDLRQRFSFKQLWSHQETGNDFTFQRDLEVKKWCREHSIAWHEPLQHGVFRGRHSRDGWAARWRQQMLKQRFSAPKSVTTPAKLIARPLPSLKELGLAASRKTQVQKGGSSEALSTLKSFLRSRGEHYQKEMSSPVTAADSCSRLSAHLAYGTISIRQVYQVLEDRQALLRRSRKAGKSTGAWLTSLASFSKRLHWHCHFIQKLEDEPALEFRNLARAYDGLRENDFSEERFMAWQQGQTGYPLIDACMRCLAETGWINFRMRALLVSFASYHLWLHWRPTALFLAKQFVDYEPGIHFSQFQMQSGTTGINAIRIYSPVKQVQDQDPGGAFIRRWVPELSQVPDIYLAQPELMPAHEQKAAHCELGVDYPLPIVDQVSALKAARDKIFSVRSTGSARREAQTVYKKHGSRKRPAARRKAPSKQGLLPF